MTGFIFFSQDEDARYFAYKDINSTHVSVILAQSLEDLVDSDVPRNLLKFRFVCDYSDGVNFLVSMENITKYLNDSRNNLKDILYNKTSNSGHANLLKNGRF